MSHNGRTLRKAGGAKSLLKAGLTTVWLAAALLMAGPRLSAAQQPALFRSVVSSPAALHNGSVCLFTVEMNGEPAALSGTWTGRELTFTRLGVGTAGRSQWIALAGVDVEAPPGSYTLALDATLKDGAVVHWTHSVAVTAAAYRTTVLRVPDRFISPDAATLKRIAGDKWLKDAAFAHHIDAPEWTGSFRPPVGFPVTEAFGSRRVFNGTLASLHRGLDFRAPAGSPVAAANGGVVVLARSLFYEGNCVVIDHGLGLMTLYMHLEKFSVAEGEQLRKGQIVGLSGATGRATGPHLHLAVRWQGAYLDPASLLRLKLPSLP